MRSKMKTKYIPVVLFLTLLPAIVSAQYDSIVNRMQKEFDTFKKGIEQEHQQFKSKNDSIFSSFLEGSWESFNMLYNPKPEEKPKPVIQPVVPDLKVKHIIPERVVPIDSSDIKNNVAPESIHTDPEKNNLPSETESSGVAVEVEFFGSTTALSLPTTLPVIKELSGSAISNYFNEVSSSLLVGQLVKQLANIKIERKLNDWGYLQMVKKTSGSITATDRDADLLSWILLLKSGINAKIGYTDNQVFLMVPALEEIYKFWFLSINDRKYYIVTEGGTKDKVPSLNVHKANYPGSLPISLELLQIPLLGTNIIHKRFAFRGNQFDILINQNLMDFYSTYPQSSLNIFFATPLSKEATGSLDLFLQPLMKDMPVSQKVALLLEFTQKTFAYKNDREQFGHEKFFFPDELFYYPYSDCEDRSILFTRLVKHFTGLSCIALNFPKHVNAAVAMGDNTTGDFIQYENRRYVICDPTYINAPVGYLPKEYSNIKPEVINFESN